MIAGSDSRCGEAGFFMPTDRCTMLIESSTDVRWMPPSLVVLLGAAQARQNQRLLAVDEVAAVELGAHLDRQRTAPQARGGVVRCRARPGRSCRPCRRTPSPRPALHRLDGGDGVQAVLARRVDVQTSASRSRNCSAGRWSMPQVRLPWTLLWPRTGDGPAPFPADVAAQQQQVDDLADGIDAVFVLGDAQTPTDQGPVRVASRSRRR